LVKQYRHGVRASTIEIPAGVMDDREEPLDAARRELREETGITAEWLEHLGRIYSAPGWSTEYIHLYLATGLTPGPTALEPDELIELLRVPLSEAIEMIRAGSIDDAKSVCALLLAQSRVRP
jgi:ADP-ribose pyrophosphatase